MGLSASAPWLRYYGNTPVSLDYPHKTMYQLVADAAKKYPKTPAYVFYGKETSYASFMRRIDAAAKGLIHMGIRKAKVLQLLDQHAGQVKLAGGGGVGIAYGVRGGIHLNVIQQTFIGAHKI